MDKEFFKQLAMGNGGSVFVFGDAVNEKHVDYEVTNVESGGKGVQVINCENYYGSTERAMGDKQVKQKDELFSGQPCQGSMERELPEELDTPEAHIVWERAKAAGYVDENLQPVANLSQNKISILASEIGEKLHFKPSWRWKPFTDFWGVKKLAKKYETSVGFNYKDDFEKEVRRALSGDDKE